MNPLTSASLTKDCITIASRHVSLDLAGNAITGPGSSTPTAGIHILTRSRRVTIAGGGAVISQFGTGVIIEGPKATVSGLSATGNTNGIVLASDRAKLTSFDASTNSNDGVLFSAASRNTLNSFTANGNDVGDGVELTSGSNRNSLSGFTAGSNGGAGVDLHKTNCSGPCKPNPVPRSNTVTGGTLMSNGTYGIVIFGGHHNSILDNSATSNVTNDLFDANPGCDHNRWFGNTFNSANRNCVD